MDPRRQLGASWANVLREFARLDRAGGPGTADHLRLLLATSLDLACEYAAAAPPPAGDGPLQAARERPGCDASAFTRECTPLGEWSGPLGEAMRLAAAAAAPRGARAAQAMRRLEQAETGLQRAHRAWAWVRSEVRAIQRTRPADAAGYLRQLTAMHVAIAQAVPVRRPPQQYLSPGPPAGNLETKVTR